MICFKIKKIVEIVKMKVKELIQLLESHDPEASVGFAHPSHDYWRTTLVSSAEGAENVPVRFSEYHTQYALADESEDDSECESMVVIFS